MGGETIWERLTEIGGDEEGNLLDLQGRVVAVVQQEDHDQQVECLDNCLESHHDLRGDWHRDEVRVDC